MELNSDLQKNVSSLLDKDFVKIRNKVADKVKTQIEIMFLI